MRFRRRYIGSVDAEKDGRIIIRHAVSTNGRYLCARYSNFRWFHFADQMYCISIPMVRR